MDGRHALRKSSLRIGAMLTVGLATFAGCSGDDEPPATNQGTPVASTGDGTLHVDGQDVPYVVDFSGTKLLLLVRLTDGCLLPMHNHVINATSTEFVFDLDVDDPSVSTLTATVHVNGLQADLPEDDAEFPETADNDFSESEIESIEESMSTNIKADTFDTMTFTASDLTTMNGVGTASVLADIAGVTTEITMNGTADMDAEGTLTITADGLLDGEPYGIYTGFGASCVDSLMPLSLKLTLKPA